MNNFVASPFLKNVLNNQITQGVVLGELISYCCVNGFVV
jgi:hypothetical protein